MTQAEETSPRTTPRAVLIGLFLSVLLAFLSVCEQAIGGELSVTEDGFGTGALALLFALVCGVGLLKRAGVVRSGLRPGELLVIFSMLLMVSAVSSKGAVAYLLPHLAGFSYYATPENGWGSRVIPLLPDGLVIQDLAAAKGFFEGLGADGEVPYGVWIGPLCAWGVLLGTFSFTTMSLMVILRKRWMEQERLPFPLAQLPFSLTAGERGEGPLLHGGVFWCGFSLPALIGLCDIAHRFIPFVPIFNFYHVARFYRNAIGVPFYANFLVMGISYLVSLDILFSIVLFVFIYYVQVYLVMASGSAILGNPGGPYAEYTHLHQEGVGALVALVGFGLYEARHHLRDVFRKAFGAGPEVDDGDELLSYRTAVVGALTGIAFICYWLLVTGISPWVIPTFVGMMLVMFLGVTRVLTETGMVMQAPLTPAQVLLHSAGTQTLGGSTVAGLFLTQPWSYPTRDGPHVMASVSTGLKLTHRRSLRSRPLFYVSLLALFAGGATAAVTMLHFAYKLGAYGFASSGYVVTGLNTYLNYYGSAIVSPSEGQPIRLLWSGVGAAVMALLILARQRFYWWPIPPIGYPASTIPIWWMNIFLAWLIKRNVLKYGGPSLYGRTRPFFLGMILGQAVITSAGSITAILTGRV